MVKITPFMKVLIEKLTAAFTALALIFSPISFADEPAPITTTPTGAVIAERSVDEQEPNPEPPASTTPLPSTNEQTGPLTVPQPSSLERIHAEAKMLLEELAKGEVMTLSDAKRIRSYQSQLKQAIESLSETERKDWVKPFNEFTAKGDALVRDKSLLVVLDNGQKILMRNHTDFWSALIRHYKMMDQSSGEIHLTRFAGIEAKEVEGLESFGEHFTNSRIGEAVNTPLFDELYSPHGNLELLDRLVRKFANQDIAQKEGPSSVIVRDKLLGYIDGTKPVFDSAMQTARDIFGNHPVIFPEENLTTDAIQSVLAVLNSLNQELRTELMKKMDEYRGEEVFKNTLRNKIANAVNGGSNEGSLSQNYRQLWEEFSRRLAAFPIQYAVNGRLVTVTKFELDKFVDNHPYSIDQAPLPYHFKGLTQYLGIQEYLTLEKFLSVNPISNEQFLPVASVNLNASTPQTSQTPADGIYFSYPARRFQVLEALLSLWPEVVTQDGKIDFARLQYRMLINSPLESAVTQARQWIEAGTTEIHAMGSKEVFTPEDYLALKQRASDTAKAVNDFFTPFQGYLFYLVQQRIQEKLGSAISFFNREVSSVLGANRNVSVQAETGESIVFNPNTLRTQILERILNSTAIRDSRGEFPREAYLRLTGFEEKFLEGLLNPDGISRLKNLSFAGGTPPVVSTEKAASFAAEEINFVLIPRLVRRFGTAHPDQMGRLFSEGIQMSVALGESLYDFLVREGRQLMQQAVNQMNVLTVQSAADLVRLKEILDTFLAAFERTRSTYETLNLSQGERKRVEEDLQGITSSVQNFYDEKIIPAVNPLADRSIEKINQLTNAARSEMQSLSPDSAEELLQLRQLLQTYQRDFETLKSEYEAAVKPFEDALINKSRVHWNGNQGRPKWNSATQQAFYSVSDLFNREIAAVNMLQVDGIAVPVRQILAIPNFPWSRNYNTKLFPNISAGDFDGLSGADNPNAHLTPLDRILLTVHIVRRLLKNGRPDEISDENVRKIFYREGLSWQVDPENFRRYVKDAYKMQAEILAAAQEIVRQAALELHKKKKDAYTIEEIEELHKKVLAARQALIDLLQKKAGEHESQDVMAAENPLSTLFQETVFNLFVSMVGASKLVMRIDGQEIALPAQVIMDRLLSILKEKYGPSVAAHHFAHFYGITLGDVRGLHKLEEYLSEQVVALPRHSVLTTVQIISKISELGFLQIGVLLVNRFAKDVVKEGKIDVDALIALLADKERTIQWVKGKAEKLAQQKIEELRKLDGTLEMNGLLKISQLMNDLKAGLVSQMNDFVSGVDDPKIDALITELQEFINQRYSEFKKVRDEILKRNLFQYEVDIDGQKYTVRVPLNETTVDRFIAFAEEYAKDHPGDINDPIIYPSDYPPGVDRSILSPLPAAASASFAAPAEGIPPIDRSIWFPIPPQDFKRADHPTRFGMHFIFARLPAKLGEFALSQDQNGNYQLDMDKFLAELLKTDQDRANRRVERIGEKELALMKTYLDSLRDEQGATPLEKLTSITERFLTVKNKLQALVNNAPKARQVWSDFVKLYESTLYGGLVSLVIEGEKYTMAGKALDDVLMELYQNRENTAEERLDPEFLKKFEEMITKGETSWGYHEFTYLQWVIPILDGIRSGSPVTSGLSLAPDGQVDAALAAGQFRMADLLMIPAITAQELNGGIDVAEKDKFIVTRMDPVKLLGLLDLRAIAPGMNPSVGGMLSAAAAPSMERAGMPDSIMPPLLDQGLPSKSSRFRITQLIPEMIKAIGASLLVKTGNRIDADRFKLALMGKKLEPVAHTYFVKQVALDVKNNFFDINHNGQLDPEDLDLYDKALAGYYEIGPASFDVSFRDIFRRTDHTNQLRTYLNYTTASEKLGWLYGGWSMRRDWMSPVWQNCIFPFFAGETLKMSLKAALESGGNLPRNLAWPIAELVSAVKKEGRGNEWFSKIRDYLDKTLIQRPDEPSDRFEARKQTAAELWEQNRTLVHYLKQSNCHNKDCIGSFQDTTMEVSILERIQKLINERVVPDIENLDVFMFYPDNGGFGGENMPYVVQMFMDDWNAVGWFIHESGHAFGYTEDGSAAPADFNVAYNESEDGTYAQPNGMFSGYNPNAYEDFAEGIRLYALQTENLIARAIQRFQTAGKIDLLEKTLILAKLYHRSHQDPADALVTYVTDERTAAVTKASLPAAWNAAGQLTQLTLSGKTYSFTYDPAAKRLIAVSAMPKYEEPQPAPQREFDDLGRLRGFVSADGKVTLRLEYDSQNRVVRIHKTEDGRESTIDLNYDTEEAAATSADFIRVYQFHWQGGSSTGPYQILPGAVHLAFWTTWHGTDTLWKSLDGILKSETPRNQHGTEPTRKAVGICQTASSMAAGADHNGGCILLGQGETVIQSLQRLNPGHEFETISEGSYSRGAATQTFRLSSPEEIVTAYRMKNTLDGEMYFAVSKMPTSVPAPEPVDTTTGSKEGTSNSEAANSQVSSDATLKSQPDTEVKPEVTMMRCVLNIKTKTLSGCTEHVLIPNALKNQNAADSPALRNAKKKLAASIAKAKRLPEDSVQIEALAKIQGKQDTVAVYLTQPKTVAAPTPAAETPQLTQPAQAVTPTPVIQTPVLGRLKKSLVKAIAKEPSEKKRKAYLSPLKKLLMRKK